MRLDFKNNTFQATLRKIKTLAFYQLKNKYKIVMWSVLSGDFDVHLSKDKSLEAVLNNTKSGNIIVFHDSLKAKEKLQYVLPRFLEHFTGKGFSFGLLQ